MRLLRDRHADAGPRAASAAAELELAAARLDDLLRDGEPDARAARSRARREAGLEHVRERDLADAAALVLDGETQDVRLARGHEAHRRALRAREQSVVEQVAERAPETLVHRQGAQ